MNSQGAGNETEYPTGQGNQRWGQAVSDLNCRRYHSHRWQHKMLKTCWRDTVKTTRSIETTQNISSIKWTKLNKFAKPRAEGKSDLGFEKSEAFHFHKLNSSSAGWGIFGITVWVHHAFKSMHQRNLYNLSCTLAQDVPMFPKHCTGSRNNLHHHGSPLLVSKYSSDGDLRHFLIFLTVVNTASVQSALKKTYIDTHRGKHSV